MSIYLPIAELPVNLLLILGLGVAVGFISGMFGVGGGFLMTPLLILVGIRGGFFTATEAAAMAVVYSLISTGFLASMMMTRVNPDLPSWFLTAFLAVALVAPIVGGVTFITCANRLTGRKRRQGGGSQ